MKTGRNFLFGGFLLLTFITQGQTSEIFSTDEGAIRGYDPVAYFTENKPVKGETKFSANYDNETWYFASAENQRKFVENPEKYLPQFGGYCAYGMSRGYKAKTEPEAFTIVNGKLYLNYNIDVRNLWNEKQSQYIIKANSNWPTVKSSTFK